ncbi:MAG: HD domain-containing protein [Methanospirillaceae archaeon]|nr:HD domain-containing protein [Methanospirillaceae archaeon]
MQTSIPDRRIEMKNRIWRQIEELATRYDTFGYTVIHEKQVCLLASMLFDDCRAVHGLGQHERDLLCIAALLHDTGLSLGQTGHHKKSRDIIRRELAGMVPDNDIGIIAAVARYHRKVLPKSDHAEIVPLHEKDRYRVNVLSSLLRIADGLDYSHSSSVTRIRCICQKEQINIVCMSSETTDLSLDLQRAREKSDLARIIFEREIVITGTNNLIPNENIPDRDPYLDKQMVTGR